MGVNQQETGSVRLKLSHHNLNIDGLKQAKTLEELYHQKQLLTEALHRYFGGTGTFSELKFGDEDIAKTRTDAMSICLGHDSVEDIRRKAECLMNTYGNDALQLAIEHYTKSGAGDIAQLQGAIDMELEVEEYEWGKKM